MLVFVVGIGALAGVSAAGELPYQQFVVRTGSMSPTIPAKSLVIVKTGEYRLGQVVSFHKNGFVVSHRLVKAKPDGSYVTKGDANRTADATPLQRGEIIGGVVHHVGQLGFWVVWLQNPVTLGSIALFIFFIWVMWPIFFGEGEPTEDEVGTKETPDGGRAGGVRAWPALLLAGWPGLPKGIRGGG